MRINKRYWFPIFASASLFAGQPASAVDVTITDQDNPSGVICANMSSLNVSAASVSLAFPGVCVGSGSAPGESVAVNQTMSVTGGSSATKDLSGGATVTLPFESTGVTVTSQGTKGTAVFSSGTSVIYYANAATSATSDSFYFRLNDATAGNSTTARVDVAIAAGGGGGGGGSCVPSATVLCKGTITLVQDATSPTPGSGDTQDKNHWKLQPNTTHVIQFTYTGASSYQLIVDQSGSNKRIKLSTTAADMSTDTTGCYTATNNTIYVKSDTDTPNVVFCELHNGTTYFLNIQTSLTAEDSYYMYVANQ